MRKPSKGKSAPSVADGLTWEADRISLKAALGLDLTADEAAFMGPVPLEAMFKPEEVIPLLGDPERGIPRMLPVDVALSRLGMSMFKLAADGSAERIRGKLHDARLKADRQIAEVVSKTRPPKDFFPQGSVFDRLSSDMRMMVFHMHERRRLAGIVPFDDRGLFLGWWCDCYSAFDVQVVGPRSVKAIYAALVWMYVRDVILLGPAPERMAGVEFYALAALIVTAGGLEVDAYVAHIAALERDPEHFSRPVRAPRCRRPFLNMPISGRGHEAWRETFVSA